jgi:hypothetical protein
VDSDKRSEKKTIVINPENWTGDEERQLLPHFRPKNMRSWHRYNSDMSKVFFVAHCVVCLLILGFVAVRVFARYFGFW